MGDKESTELTKVNLYFLSALVIAALLFVLVEVGVRIHKREQLSQYSTFNLFVGEKSVLYIPLSQGKVSLIRSSGAVNGSVTSFDKLSTGTGYSLSTAVNNDNGVSFIVQPDLNGEFTLASPGEDSLVFHISNQQGQEVSVLTPGKWYTVWQTGRRFSIELKWNK